MWNKCWPFFSSTFSFCFCFIRYTVFFLLSNTFVITLFQLSHGLSCLCWTVLRFPYMFSFILASPPPCVFQFHCLIASPLTLHGHFSLLDSTEDSCQYESIDCTKDCQLDFLCNLFLVDNFAFYSVKPFVVLLILLFMAISCFSLTLVVTNHPSCF